MHLLASTHHVCGATLCLRETCQAVVLNYPIATATVSPTSSPPRPLVLTLFHGKLFFAFFHFPLFSCGQSLGRDMHNFRIDVQFVGTKSDQPSRGALLGGSPMRATHCCLYGFGYENMMTHAVPGCPSSGHHWTMTCKSHNSFIFGGWWNMLTSFFFLIEYIVQGAAGC
jgi:hypothetical protein